MRKAVPLDCFHFADRVPGKTGGGTLHLCVAAGQVVRGSTNTRVRFAFLVRMRQKRGADGLCRALLHGGGACYHKQVSGGETRVSVSPGESKERESCVTNGLPACIILPCTPRRRRCSTRRSRFTAARWGARPYAHGIRTGGAARSLTPGTAFSRSASGRRRTRVRRAAPPRAGGGRPRRAPAASCGGGYPAVSGPRVGELPTEPPFRAYVAFCDGPCGESIEFFQELGEAK